MKVIYPKHSFVFVEFHFLLPHTSQIIFHNYMFPLGLALHLPSGSVEECHGLVRHTTRDADGVVRYSSLKRICFAADRLHGVFDNALADTQLSIV